MDPNAAINGRSFTKGNQTSTPGASPGVFFIWCRGGAITEACQGFRAAGLHGGQAPKVTKDLGRTP